MSATPGELTRPAKDAALTTQPRTTERDVLDLLHERYSQMTPDSFSPRYAVAEHVRSNTGMETRRTIDFMALDCWPRQGMHLHGHEVKVSRSDWLRELREPEKSVEFRSFCNRWWLVVSDAKIVHPGELPDGWGLMAPASTGRLRVRHAAPVLDPAPLPRTFLAALARSIQRTPHRGLPDKGNPQR